MDIIEQLSATLALSPDFKTDFFRTVETIRLPKKSFFVREGQVCNYLGLMGEGCLFSSTSTSKGKELVNEFYLPDSFVTSYRSFLTRCPSLGSIQAYDKTVLYAISYETYGALSQSLDWLKFFKYISEVLFIQKCSRTTSLTTDSAATRYQNLVLAHPGIEQRFPQYLIASYLNVRPETLSRIKSLDLHQGKEAKRAPTFEL